RHARDEDGDGDDPRQLRHRLGRHARRQRRPRGTAPHDGARRTEAQAEDARLAGFFGGAKRLLRRFTSSASPRTRRNAPSPSARSSTTAQVAKIWPRSFCSDHGRKISASTRRASKNATIAARSFATSSGRRALITTQPLYFFLRAFWSPPWSILLK